MKFEIRNKIELNEKEVYAVVELLCLIWPPDDQPLDLEKEIKNHIPKNRVPFDKVLLLWDNDTLVGHTEVFARDVFSAGKTIHNMALGGVCVRPEYRKRNFGFQLVRKAFEFTDKGHFDCSVFQTGVPGFYEKMGCRKIHNRFVNSLDKAKPEANPWHDEHIMLYPGSFEIGEDIIDLNGAGY